jgi:hypothetical protein
MGNKCIYRPPVGNPRVFTRQLGAVYIVETTPNSPTNHGEYKVTGSLQSFLIYSYFHVKTI